MEFTTSGSFHSHRSYPSLQHISLTPLNPRFPIDDDTGPTDYFNHRDHETPASGTRTPPASSYLSSVSVPSTPPILSHSRSNSRSRHHTRSKTSTWAGSLSDMNLHKRELSHALHHVQDTHKKHPSISHSQGRRPLPDITPKSKSDAEWMLRAGIALASSTREEKGQSWLSKRESSTNLTPFDETSTNRHHRRTRSGASWRHSRSGASTPGGAGALSRRASRSRAGSRAGSRRGSRVDLTMTALPVVSCTSTTSENVCTGSGTNTGTATRTASPETCGRIPLVPDFVDAHLRAEMVSLQHHERRLDEDSLYWDGAGSDEDETSSEYSCSSDEMPDDFDEADLQQLTRERGFGLGSWIDRLVEWTLFGVEEWPVAPAAAASRIGETETTTTVTFEEPGLVAGRDDDMLSLGSVGDGDMSDGDSSRGDGYSSTGSAAPIEKPGNQGGWEDAEWLFRLMKRALV
ncbi:Monooxygenase FAD-binding [Penicillium cf. griseofulvum]|uniref:Monooxygenase FAD-binding n=1 Tax=Penicillium cf. griseofulvum TaxID=2972120 RepID=A0A9W9M980_9EURO|nr:Monooxygenase FAD-binding [Penicillium cf. griseofulvum]KAJ5445209.1 Monooxygenase FAD-binding [Penicillium cf. griseofulvum]KAJ5446933.1 Monooxygenase FAD-binding [Penicillium cf. griseofulvum]